MSDEASDISRTEQVSACLPYLTDGVTKEVFDSFYETNCTKWSVLYKLIKKVLDTLKLDITNVVGQCYDGASNMSVTHEGLAIQVKEDGRLHTCTAMHTD